MKLKLVLKGPDRLMGAQAEKYLENGGLVIGRSPNADWTLPDPERIVSKTHCRIDKDFSGFVLTDTSTNGVRINDDSVGFGLPRLLSDGDVLILGDAVILARIETQPPEMPRQKVTEHQPPSAALAKIPEGPFGPVDNAAESQQPASAARPGGAGTSSSAQVMDDWWAPENPPAIAPDPISVDISPKQAPASIHNTIMGQDPLASHGGDVAKLAVSLAGLDLAAFAQAVDEAATIMPESERLKFNERLRDLLRGSISRGK